MIIYWIRISIYFNNKKKTLICLFELVIGKLTMKIAENSITSKLNCKNTMKNNVNLQMISKKSS